MKKIPSFDTKKELFKYLVENKKELINFKKATQKFTDAIGIGQLQPTEKAISTNYKDDVESGMIQRTIIGNTYNWMDSHDDVHLDNVFTESIKQKQDKIWHLHDHEQKITSKVGKPTAIYEKSIAWKDLGINKEGKTTALFMDSNIMKSYNPTIFQEYLNKEVNQHSVCMYYVQIDLAVNDAEMKAEFSTWNKHINNIGNKEQVIEQGYFWAVKEAKLVEISAVLAGSNELTPTIDNEEKVVDNPKPKEKINLRRIAEKL